MRKILLGLLILVVVLVGIAVALPFVLPREMIKAEVERQVSAELGRAFTIEGPLTFRPWRPFELTMDDVRLANPDWAEQPDLARIARVELEVDALAYLDGTIALERLVIEQPVLALERREDGTASWQLGGGEEDHAEGGPGAGEDRRPGDIRIGEVRVSGGSVSLDDRASGETRQFEEIELWARGDPASPGLLVDGSVLGGGERATLNAAIGDLNGLLAGEPSSVSLEVDLPGVGLVADGEASPAGSAVLAIDLEATPRRLMDWLGQPVTLPEGTLEAVQLSVDVEAASDGIGLRALNLSVDELSVQGDLELALSTRPALTGRLDLGDLDLVPYLPPADEAAAEAPAENGAGDEAGAQAGWPEEPLDLPLPLPLDLGLDLVFSRLATPKIELGAGRLRLTADEAASAIEIQELALYDGSMTGRASLAGGDPLGLDATLEAADIQLQPLLEAVAGVDRLAGTGNVSLAVTAEGRSVAELVRNLGGEGAVLARDGAILGINIAATIRQVTTLGAVSAAAEPERTDFAEAGGTFTIASGVLENEDFALRAPVLRVTGAGSVDLGARTLDYRLQPRLAATLQGQDAASEDAFQAGVPLVIEGPWADPAIRLDMAGVLSGDIGDPAALGELVRGLANDPARLENLRDQLGIDPGSAVGEALQGLGGLLGTPPAGAAGDGAAASDGTAEEEAGATPSEDPVGRALDSLGTILGR